MKTIMTYTLALLMTATVAMGQDSGEIEIPFSTPSAPGKIKIDIKKGSITVKGTDRKDVLVRYSPMKRKNSDHAHEHDHDCDNCDDKQRNTNGLRKIPAATLDLEISERDNYIEIESDSWNKGLDLIVEVPKSLKGLHVETYNSGDIEVSNVSGEINLDNYNGKISATSISGSLVAETYNGSITATFDDITPDVPMAFSTYNGHVDLTLPDNFKASLKMKTKQGEVYSAFDFILKKTDPVRKTDSKSGTYKVYLDDWVRGDVNGGGPEFMIKNYNGNIYLRKK